jgi:tripartite-type tricarboxylate transporter receptor subunit TctC
MTRKINRRECLGIMGAATLSLTLPVSNVWGQAEVFPLKSIKVIVPLPAGGAADASVRIFAEHFTNYAKQSLVIDNKPGGIFQIAMQSIAQAPADGYTLIHLNSGMVSAQVVNKKYDMLKQLVPVALMGSTDGILAASPSAPFKTAQELIVWARANPGKLNYGSAGPGSIEHLTTSAFLKKFGITGTHIPFKGGPDAMTALAQGEIHIFTTAVPLVWQFMQKNLARPLGIMVDKRSPLMPEVATLKEQGIDIPALQFWGGMAAPAGTPKAVIETLQGFISAALKTPTLQTRFAGLGMLAAVSSSDEFARQINEDLKWMTLAAQDLELK